MCIIGGYNDVWKFLDVYFTQFLKKLQLLINNMYLGMIKLFLFIIYLYTIISQSFLFIFITFVIAIVLDGTV